MNLLTDRLQIVSDPPTMSLPDCILYLENEDSVRYLFQFNDFAEQGGPIYQGVKNEETAV